MYAGFEILPTNISQAVALAKLTIDELIQKWRSIIETLPPDKITAHSIRNAVKPTTESEPAVASLEVPASIHEDIHREAANRGLSIGEFLKIILSFFIKSENLHLLEHQNNTESYREKERIWQEDLASLVAEKDNSLASSFQT